MGIDVLDITFRIEKQIGLRISGEDWNRLIAENDGSRDVRAGQLLELALERRACRKCRCGLLGYPESGACPECGTRFDYSETEQLWEELRIVLSEALRVKREKITRDSQLIKDLGMT